MKIGYCVEGSTDDAFIAGLRDRWCNDAELVRGSARGSTGLAIRRELPKICLELNSKGCDVFVVITDSNDRDWRDVLAQQQESIPIAFRDRSLCGVAGRNIECWLCSDVEWISNETGRDVNEFRVEDPKLVFNRALGIVPNRDNKKEVISLMTTHAPLRSWLQHSPSFERFYRTARKLGNSIGCRMPDEMAAES